MTTSPLLTEQQAAEMLGTTARTMQSWRQQRKPPVWVKLHKSVRYRAADLEAFIAESVVVPKGAK